MKIWQCRVGSTGSIVVPTGADGPMRDAVQRAFRALTHEKPEFIFSGWNGRLSYAEQIVLIGSADRLGDPKDVLLTIDPRSRFAIWCNREGWCPSHGPVEKFKTHGEALVRIAEWEKENPLVQYEIREVTE